MDKTLAIYEHHTTVLHPPVIPIPAEQAPRRKKWADTQSTNSNDGHPENFLAQAALLNLMGQPPINFHRLYADITGNVVTGLWLSHVLTRVSQAASGEFDGDDYIFFMSASECHQTTGITTSQQRTCRRDLINLGILSEQSGAGKVPLYRLHMAVVAQLILQASSELAISLEANDKTITEQLSPS